MKKKTMTVGELKDFIKDLPEYTKIYITSDDLMPVRVITDIGFDEQKGYYSELYLDTEEW